MRAAISTNSGPIVLLLPWASRPKPGANLGSQASLLPKIPYCELSIMDALVRLASRTGEEA